MNYINRKDTQHKEINKGRNPQYSAPKMDKFSDKEIKNAIRIYTKALAECEKELKRRQNAKR